MPGIRWRANRQESISRAHRPYRRDLDLADIQDLITQLWNCEIEQKSDGNKDNKIDTCQECQSFTKSPAAFHGAR